MTNEQPVVIRSSTLTSRFREIDVTLLPGTAELYQITYNSNSIERVYRDDFSKSRFRTDALTSHNLMAFRSEGKTIVSAIDASKTSR